MLEHDFSHGNPIADEEFAQSHEAMQDAVAAASAANALGIADWADGPLRQWRTRTTNVLNLVESAGHGMATLGNLSVMLEALYDPEHSSPADDADAAHRAREVREVTKSAERASDEVQRGFPLLHVLGTVWIWASLEALFEDLVLAALTNDPRVADEESFRDLRIPWAVAASGDAELLARTVYHELENKRGSSFKGGVSRFEGLLSAVRLGGQVPETVRREIFELSQVRNVILHRGGLADETLVEQCPWMGVTVGDELRITHHRFEEYVFAALHYVALVQTRLATHYPAAQDPSRPSEAGNQV